MKPILRFILPLFLFSSLIFSCFYLPLFAQKILHEASFYKKLEKRSVQCLLCPRNCVIAPSKRGFCGVRENQGGVLYTLSYAKPVAIHIDPVEKKPLFHFFPKSKAFSIATAGCNLRCKFCQNWDISQKLPEEVRAVTLEPAALVEKAKQAKVRSIAYTYTEPTIFYEYMYDVAQEARKAGIKNVMHSSGYINEVPLRNLCKVLDAANIDLKGFSDDYYRDLTQGSLAPVLNTLKTLKDEGVHVEITNLVLPGYNDDPELIRKMCGWIKDNLGDNTPLHFSRFYPMYQLLALNPTPVGTLERAREIALACGLKYVYIGNVPGHMGEHTYCPKCRKALIKRQGYVVTEINIDMGNCVFCGEKIDGFWE